MMEFPLLRMYSSVGKGISSLPSISAPPLPLDAIVGRTGFQGDPADLSDEQHRQQAAQK